MKKKLAAALVASMIGMGIPNPYSRTIAAQHSKNKSRKTKADHLYIEQAEIKREHRRQRNRGCVNG